MSIGLHRLVLLEAHPRVKTQPRIKKDAGYPASAHSASENALEPVLKFRGVLFSSKRPKGEARRDRGSIPGAGCDRGSHEARGPFARKPFGRRLFCPWPSLARPLQPAEGMLGPRRLGHGQNPSPQDPTQFQNRLLEIFSRKPCGLRSRNVQVCGRGGRSRPTARLRKRNLTKLHIGLTANDNQLVCAGGKVED